MRSAFGRLLVHVSFATFTLALSARAQVCEIVERQTALSGLQTEDPSTGTSIAIDGDTAIIGAPGSDSTAGRTWFIFRESPSAPWGPPTEILPNLSVHGDYFGHSIGMEGDVAVIGAPGSANVPGAAYIFRRIDGVWLEEAKLTPTDSASNDMFARSVDIDGDYVVVGKPKPFPGSAYVYKNTGKEWELDQVLVPAQTIGTFGGSVSIDANRILVAAFDRAIMFHHNGVEWQEQQPPLLGPAVAVELQGDVALTRAFLTTVRIFALQDGTWALSQTLTSPNGMNEEFGASFALQDDVLLVGATNHIPETVGAGFHQAGCVYKFKFEAGQWVLQHKLVCSRGPDEVSDLGRAVAIDGEEILIADKLPFYVSGFGEVLSYSVEPIDCNSNGIPDRCDEPDCDGNALVDSCEISPGRTLTDCDANGVADLCEAPAAYVWDDGNPYTSWGNGGIFSSLFDFLWLNQFSVLPASQIITRIDIAFGKFTAEGLPIKLLIYDDPNNDGHPSDATLIRSVDSFTHSYASGFGFLRVNVPPTYVGEVGDSFFIGAMVSLDFHGCSVALADNATTQGRSWRKSAPLGQMDLGTPGATGNYLTLNQDFMVRGVSSDCNGNGTWDQCDIDSGFSADVNGNGLPDECEGSCAADLAPQKGNSVVDVDDLLFVINNWGVCESGEPCQADVAPVGGNGIVDVDDLVFVINNWGPCL
jgi:hypothetical protein